MEYLIIIDQLSYYSIILFHHHLLDFLGCFNYFYLNH